MSGVSSGKLRHFVQLQRPIQIQDPISGAMVKNWVNVGRKVWMDIVPSSAREFVAAGAEQSEVRGRATLRFRADVDATMRAVYRNKAYHFLGVMPDAESMKGHMTLMICEGVIL